jgi:uncharacterized RDD family membrane protein YckC
VEYGERLTITTPEGVTVELPLAGIGSRFLATMLDLLIIGAVALVGVLVSSALLDGGILTLVLFVGGFLLIFGYDVAFEVANHGRTPGKKAAGLRVLRESGAPVTFITSAIRNAMRLVDILPGVYGIAMVSIFVTRNNQRLGDLAAGTIVVRERTTAPAAESPLAAPRVYGWDTSAITAEDLAIVRAFLDRRPTLSPGARAQLAGDLATRLRAKVAGAPELEAEPFLETLVASRD